MPEILHFLRCYCGQKLCAEAENADCTVFHNLHNFPRPQGLPLRSLPPSKASLPPTRRAKYSTDFRQMSKMTGTESRRIPSVPLEESASISVHSLPRYQQNDMHFGQSTRFRGETGYLISEVIFHLLSYFFSFYLASNDLLTRTS